MNTGAFQKSVILFYFIYLEDSQFHIQYKKTLKNKHVHYEI